jgi:hypothetical protein
MHSNDSIRFPESRNDGPACYLLLNDGLLPSVTKDNRHCCILFAARTPVTTAYRRKDKAEVTTGGQIQ